LMQRQAQVIPEAAVLRDQPKGVPEIRDGCRAIGLTQGPAEMSFRQGWFQLGQGIRGEAPPGLDRLGKLLFLEGLETIVQPAIPMRTRAKG